MKPENDRDRTAEARRALDRMASESETIGGSALARTARHFSGGDAPANDPVEVWGRRIGRGLGAVFFVYLVYALGQHFAG